MCVMLGGCLETYLQTVPMLLVLYMIDLITIELEEDKTYEKLTCDLCYKLKELPPKVLVLKKAEHYLLLPVPAEIRIRTFVLFCPASSWKF